MIEVRPKTRVGRFLLKIRFSEYPDGCWQWTGSKHDWGHGRFWNGERDIPAHRYAYELFFGPISPDMFCCHRCDNPSCVNPSHLFIGSAQDNTSDAASKGRMAQGERHGQAKLNERQARYCLNSDERNIDLARRFGVTEASIRSVRKGRTWKHLAADPRKVSGRNVPVGQESEHEDR